MTKIEGFFYAGWEVGGFCSLVHHMYDIFKREIACLCMVCLTNILNHIFLHLVSCFYCERVLELCGNLGFLLLWKHFWVYYDVCPDWEYVFGCYENDQVLMKNSNFEFSSSFNEVLTHEMHKIWVFKLISWGTTHE